MARNAPKQSKAPKPAETAPDKNAAAPATTAPTETEGKDAATETGVTVRALKPLAESDTLYAPGDTFETTAARAKALGALVEKVEGA